MMVLRLLDGWLLAQENHSSCLLTGCPVSAVMRLAGGIDWPVSSLVFQVENPRLCWLVCVTETQDNPVSQSVRQSVGSDRQGMTEERATVKDRTTAKCTAGWK